MATTLDVIGDKWSLLLIRDMGLFDRHRNKDFQNGKEGIPSNILADRLRSLQALGLVHRIPYQQRPVRYEYHLTESGADLLPIIKEMARWGVKHVDGVKIPEKAVKKPVNKSSSEPEP